MAKHRRLRAEYDRSISLRAELVAARALLSARQKELVRIQRAVAASVLTVQAIEKQIERFAEKKAKP